jgi:hypothetical protein
MTWVISFTSSPPPPQKTAHGIHWNGGWVGPRKRPDYIDKIETPPVAGDRTQIPLTFSAYPGHYANCANTVVFEVRSCACDLY